MVDRVDSIRLCRCLSQRPRRISTKLATFSRLYLQKQVIIYGFEFEGKTGRRMRQYARHWKSGCDRTCVARRPRYLVGPGGRKIKRSSKRIKYPRRAIT